ncbi:MAG TPA: SprT family zinc-dependent metalloprotease [Longimicrobiales bacterium]|nr:SprT family zinc-dependent metalloprotease [Longimicrobiales bacterium]
MRKRPFLDEQLSLPLADLDEAGMLDALRARGATRLQRVRFRRNRSRMVSLSADHSSLNLQECFRSAPGPVIDAIAEFVTAPSSNAAFRRAVARMRRWWDGQEGEDESMARPAALPCCATPAQAAVVATLFARLNRTHFDGSLPGDIPLRVSDRMSRRFGHIHYTRRGGNRVVVEIALNVDLLLRGNERHLEETLLHEMAHAEAWLAHGHRGHGPVWRAIARRVGCEPRACSRVRIRRRQRGTRVTDIPLIAAHS